MYERYKYMQLFIKAQLLLTKLGNKKTNTIKKKSSLYFGPLDHSKEYRIIQYYLYIYIVYEYNSLL